MIDGNTDAPAQGGAPASVEAALETLAAETPEAEASEWDPDEDGPALDADALEDDGEALPPQEDDEPAKLPDLVPVKISADAQRALNARTLEARERARMTEGFYIDQAPGVAEHDGEDEEPDGYDEEGDSEEDTDEPEPEGDGETESESLTLNLKELQGLNEAQASFVTERPGVDYLRPRRRGDCLGDERPCPFVSCRWHLYLDVLGDGSIKFNFPDIDVAEMKHSCTLDLADQGGVTLNEAGRALNVSRERIRQMELKIGAKIKKRSTLAQFVESAPLVVNRGRLPVVQAPALAVVEEPPSLRTPAPLAAPAPAPPRPVPPKPRSPRREAADLTGQTFGLLTVKSRVPPSPEHHGLATWLCDCTCGGTKIMAGVSLRKKGAVPSCGHEKREREKAAAAARTEKKEPARATRGSSSSRNIIAPTALFDIPRIHDSIRRAHPGTEHIDRVTEAGLVTLSAYLRTILYVLHQEGRDYAAAGLRFNVALPFLRKMEARALSRLGVRVPSKPWTPKAAPATPAPRDVDVSADESWEY